MAQIGPATTQGAGTGAHAGPAEPILLLAGPTAVGKSAVALELARILPGEIISVDSMQVYRGLEIGTAKPSAAERRQVPHHLIDVVRLTESFDAAQFVRRARQAVRDIVRRGRVPIFCGGTGLYFKAYLEGLGASPPTDPAMRAQLEATSMPDLLRELQENDPATYERIDRRNRRRIVRALEVIRLTGQPFSKLRAEWPGTAAPGPSGFFGLEREPADLRQRIQDRVDAMFAQGLVAETQALLAHGLADNPTALQALGYRQVVEHLRGQRSLAETVDLVKTRTWQFARRQMTWFRHQARLEWLKLGVGDSAAQVAHRMAERWRGKS